MSQESVAVIGGGVSGIVAAYILQQRFDVTLFEANEYLGGHTNTVVIRDGEDKGTAVDTGFIVCNDRTYPHFHSFLQSLDVPVRYADMSFSVVNSKSGLQYGSRDLNMLFAQRKNLINPRFLKFLLGIQKFWNQAKKDVANDSVHEMTLKSYLEKHHIAQNVIYDFIVPISAAIWSTPDKLMMEFPIGLFLRFYSNHGLLGYIDQPRWQTVVGGSFSYVKAFKNRFKGRFSTDTPVHSVSRKDGKAFVRLQDGTQQSFDRLVMATHADEAFRLLEDPTLQEKQNLAHWKYLLNDTILHTDDSFLPSNKRAWASWNYCREVGDIGNEPLSITYYMNLLQGLTTRKHYSVTLNSRKPISPEKIIAQFKYTHPHFTVDSMKSQSAITKHNGDRNTWYCGSYMGFGFHEDAVKSAVAVGRQLGCSL